MPQSLPHACTAPLCPNLTRERFCPAHQQMEPPRATDTRPTSTERGYDANWRRIRLNHLMSEPLCRLCAEIGLTQPATDVDHIDGDVTNCEDSNLRSLCHGCHSRKTIRENHGWGHGQGPLQNKP